MNVSFASCGSARRAPAQDHRADADARARRSSSCERHVDHVQRAIHDSIVGSSVALEADVVVRVVLEQQEVVLGRQRTSRSRFAGSSSRPAGILEVRDDVDDARLPSAPAELLERVDVDAVGAERQRFHRGAEPLEEQDRAIVRGRLDDGEPPFPANRCSISSATPWSDPFVTSTRSTGTS
jgi:hypothetical protein